MPGAGIHQQGSAGGTSQSPSLASPSETGKWVWPSPPPDQFASIGPCTRTGKDVTLCYNTFGSPSDPCMLLIMGLGCPAPYWDTRLCAQLAAAGFFVVRYDNRDVGLSTRFDELRPPSIFRLAVPRWLSPCEVESPYLIDDMAADAVRLLDHLNVQQAHVVGCSLGGAIAQSVLIHFPRRVRSVCLLSTSSGVPLPEPHILLRLLDRPRDPTSVDSVVEYKTRFFRALAGRLPLPTEEFQAGIRWSANRSTYEGGTLRQLTAMARSPDRSAPLSLVNASHRRRVPPQGRGYWALAREVLQWAAARFFRSGSASSPRPQPQSPSRPPSDGAESPFIPVVILHGGCDPIIPPSNAQKLAQLIPGAKMVMYPEMGHYFPPSMFDPLAQEMILNARHGESIARRQNTRAPA